MSLPTVVAFPRGTGSGRVRPAAPRVGQLILFPSASGGLTAKDTRTLTDLILALHGDWRCQIERDGCGELWAVIGARQPVSGCPSCFLVCRVEGRLLLIDGSLENRWRTLGFYDHVEGLASDLAGLVGWHQTRGPGSKASV